MYSPLFSPSLFEVTPETDLSLEPKYLRLLATRKRPQIDPRFNHVGMRFVLEYDQGDADLELQSIAIGLLDYGRVKEAWQVLLKCTHSTHIATL